MQKSDSSSHDDVSDRGGRGEEAIRHPTETATRPETCSQSLDGEGGTSVPNAKHWFTISFLGGRCRKAMLGVCVCHALPLSAVYCCHSLLVSSSVQLTVILSSRLFLSVRLSVHMSPSTVCSSASPFDRLFICLSFRPSVHLSVLRLSFLRLSVHLSLLSTVCSSVSPASGVRLFLIPFLTSLCLPFLSVCTLVTFKICRFFIVLTVALSSHLCLSVGYVPHCSTCQQLCGQ